MDQFEREERDLEQQHQDGMLTDKEYNQAMRDLQRAYRDEAEEAARDAYDREMERWGKYNG